MRVLVIEDEPDLLSALAQALREGGFAVDEADSGTDGLYKATEWDYDAILLDLMIPGLDGWEILRRLRAKKTTPVLILTARDAISDRVRGLDIGADDYLLKPFNLTELLARVRALIRRAVGRPDATFTLHDVTINTVRRTVFRCGQPVVLTAREYAIVELLAHRSGQVVSKTQIYEHIFDETDDTLSNLVEVHVSNVRKKLGREFIHTIRGMGYVVDR